jgi:hypothetical protein
MLYVLSKALISGAIIAAASELAKRSPALGAVTPALHEALLSEITSKRDMNRTRAELVSALNEQLGAIKASSAAFDAGVTWEATRLATAAYVILHDGKRRTVSLLTQLGVKEKIPFISSSVPANPNNLLAKMPLRAAWTRLMNDTPAGLIRKEGYTFHGLRASSVEKLRERGCDNLQIEAITGMSPTMITRYSRFANQKRLAKAAVRRLEDRTIREPEE